MPPIELDLPVPKPELDKWGGKLNAAILVLLQAVNDSVADVTVVDGHLFAVHQDGSQTDLGPLPVGPPGGVNKVAGLQGEPTAQQLVDAIATPLSAQTVQGMEDETSSIGTSLVARVKNIAATAIAGAGAVREAVDARVRAVVKPRNALNILDFDVTLGASTSQTAAIKAALDANPGRAFYFPPGDYRLDTTLVISTNNSIYGTDDTRFYAGASMDILVRYDNGSSSAPTFTRDKAFIGPTLDCALLAKRGLYLSSFLRFTLDVTVIDPIKRAFVTGPLGAELNGHVRAFNAGSTNSHRTVSVGTTSGSTALTGTGFTSDEVGDPIFGTGIPAGATIATVTNATTATLSHAATATGSPSAAIITNIGIEANAGDCIFIDCNPRDFTIGIWDKGGNRWIGCHPWLGVLSQLQVRYPVGVAWLLSSSSLLKACEADTYRYMFRTANPNGVGPETGKTKTIDIDSPKAFVLTTNITNALAAANPGVVLDLQDGARTVVRAGRFQGHGVTSHAFTAGDTKRLTVQNPGDDVPGSVTGLVEYKRGVQAGTAIDFSPTFYGHITGLGDVVYTTRAGRMEVRDGQVTYTGRIVGSLGGGSNPGVATGNYRVGNLPFPAGAATVGLGVGSILRKVGVASAFELYGANGANGAGTLTAIVYDASGAEIAVTAGQSFDIRFTITSPFTYPS